MRVKIKYLIILDEKNKNSIESIIRHLKGFHAIYACHTTPPMGGKTEGKIYKKLINVINNLSVLIRHHLGTKSSKYYNYLLSKHIF